jgi:formylglycine-generating enzyme required for sulfatase activity
MLSTYTWHANMSKSKLRNQIFITIASICLVTIPLQAHAAKKAKKETKVQPIVIHPAPKPLKPGEIFRDCPNCPDMVVIKAGDFDMGSVYSEEKDEKPERRISIAKPFAMGSTEITRDQFAMFVRASGYNAGNQCMAIVDDKWEEVSVTSWVNPGYTQEDNHPVACINWNDAQAYVKWLSRMTGKHYQLPTETQWEYACKAGEQAQYCGNDDPEGVAWYEHNSANATHPVATKQPNAFGLYDMSGNVGEWVEDNYHVNYTGLPVDGSAWAGENENRVLRGGSWSYSRTGLRSTFRSVSAPEYRYFDTGFRVVSVLPASAVVSVDQ